MRALELIRFLHQNDDTEVIIKLEDGLYYPIKDVKLSAGKLVIVAEDIHGFVEKTNFEPLDFNDSVEYVLITEQKK